MASFEKRGNGVRAIVSFADGRRQATFDTMAEARAWAAEMEKASATLWVRQGSHTYGY